MSNENDELDIIIQKLNNEMISSGKQEECKLSHLIEDNSNYAESIENKDHIESTENKEQVEDEEVECNFEKLITFSRFPKKILWNAINYLNGKKSKGRGVKYEEAEDFLIGYGFDIVLDCEWGEQKWRYRLKEFIKKSERKFDHSKYKIAHSVYNFEGIIAECFSDDYRNRSDIRWQKDKTIKLCEIQCILYFLTKKLLESGPCYISRNYYLNQSKHRNIQSLKDRYFRMTGEIIIEDYKKYNPAYLNRLLNKLNPKRGGKGKRNKFTEEEKHIMIRHFGRRLNHKKISFIHQLLESKRLIRITRKSYKSNYIEMRKRNPFYKFI